MGQPDGLDLHLSESLDLCARQEAALQEELDALNATLATESKEIDAIRRLKTIPAVGDLVAARIYAAVGDISRFPNARALASYAGLVPCVHQSGDVLRTGRITRMGAAGLRGVLIQAGHVLLFRCDPVKAGPRRAIQDEVVDALAAKPPNGLFVAMARQLLGEPADDRFARAESLSWPGF